MKTCINREMQACRGRLACGANGQHPSPHPCVADDRLVRQLIRGHRCMQHELRRFARSGTILLRIAHRTLRIAMTLFGNKASKETFKRDEELEDGTTPILCTRGNFSALFPVREWSWDQFLVCHRTIHQEEKPCKLYPAPPSPSFAIIDH